MAEICFQIPMVIENDHTQRAQINAMKVCIFISVSRIKECANGSAEKRVTFYRSLSSLRLHVKVNQVIL